MAGKRMFAKTIIDSDAFLDMPLSTQALYFHLNMRADDDGFVNNPKQIQRMIGCGDDDRKLLIAKKFVIPFESGICVIKHWKIHNYIAKDRYKPTVYEEEKNQLYLKENKAYTINKPNTKCIQNVTQDVIQNDNNVYKEENAKNDVNPVIPTHEEPCIQNVYNLDTQIRLDKNRLDKDRIGKDRREENSLEKTYEPEPLILPTPIHQKFYELVGNVGYKTWFTDTEINEEESVINIKTYDDFKRNVILSKYATKLESVLNKRIEVI
ncbi:hypothetical protein [Clostridium baratii]|uniref:hypothetical protein n=1 Tax=Clostridium baratii TaxID=1561 RepID=UPI0030D021D4